MDIVKIIAKQAREWRINNKITVEEIAKSIHYSIWNVYRFEEGRNDSATILYAYIKRGFSL